MLRPIFGGILGAALFASAASAQCTTSIPNNLANGTTADATKVMANFTWITNCIGGTYLTAAPDIRLGVHALSLQETQANEYAWITLIPSTGSAETGYRLYNGSDPNNVGLLDYYINGSAAKMQPTTYGTGTAVTSINFALPNVEFSAIGTTASAANAYLDPSGYLLKSTSSVRYKRDVRPLTWEEERKVLDLVPVSFRSKAPADDPNRVFEG